MSSFGVRFGQLVRTKRGIEGWTQQQLAVEAFGDEAKKARISELESGKIANPHQATVDALVVALRITPEEVAECRGERAAPALPPDLLKYLASQFDQDHPKGSEAELAGFLEEKAKDYREMRARLDALQATDIRLDNVMPRVKGALEAGRFDLADELLAEAEELHLQERALEPVRQQAAFRVERGNAALLKGDVEQAAERFREGAEILGPFAAEEAGGVANDGGDGLWQYALRFGGEGLVLAVALHEKAQLYWPRADLPEKWGWAENAKGNALRDQGTRIGGADGAARLGEAVSAYRAALEVRTREAMP
ncbi:MAG: helix-turn-helix transcriptional regulator, partial [Pseudomonadota bacterium]